MGESEEIAETFIVFVVLKLRSDSRSTGFNITKSCSFYLGVYIYYCSFQ
jgi:hypothetical protein